MLARAVSSASRATSDSVSGRLQRAEPRHHAPATQISPPMRASFDPLATPHHGARVLSDAFAGLQKLMLPDRWQALALTALRAGRDVIVDAPTGAGKTYVFERWAEQTNFAKRALFPVPTRALANDKFAEWRARDWNVGIMTGDLCVNPEAPIVVATLEAVQGLIVEGAAARLPRASVAGASSRSGRFQLLVVDE